MYCGECGSKNSNTSKFCENCGAPLENNDNEKNQLDKSKKRKEENRASTNKIILIVVAVVLVIGAFLGIKGLKEQTLPETVAKKYFEAYKNSDSRKMYQYFDIDESLNKNAFTTKKMFINTIVTESQKEKASKIQSYQITKIDPSSDGLTVKATINYTTTTSLSSNSMELVLKKSKKKKFLFFNNWKVSLGDNYIREDYTISLPKGSKATLEGVDLTKYKDNNKSTSQYDVYKIDKIFRGEYSLKSSLSYGFNIDEKINTTLSSTYKVNISKTTVPKNTQKEITEKAKEFLTTYYNGVISNTGWEQIKEKLTLVDTNSETNLKSAYEKLSSTLNRDNKKLTKYNVTSIDISEISTPYNDSYGDITVSFNVKYDYELNYKPLFSDEMKTKTSSSSGRVKLDFKYNEKTFSIYHITTFVNSFN